MTTCVGALPLNADLIYYDNAQYDSLLWHTLLVGMAMRELGGGGAYGTIMLIKYVGVLLKGVYICYIIVFQGTNYIFLR